MDVKMKKQTVKDKMKKKQSGDLVIEQAADPVIENFQKMSTRS